MDSLLLPSPSPEPQNTITDPTKPIISEKETKNEMIQKRKRKGKKKESFNDDEASSSSTCSSSATSNLNSTKRVSRVALRLRNPPVRLGIARRSVVERQAEALALPLGMSFAAFANLVLERKNVAGQNIYVDDLAMISASAVRESLANVYGNNLGSFATNFEKSFNSTLKILKLINGTTNQLDNNHLESCSLDERSDNEQSATTSNYDTIQDSTRTASSMNEIVLHQSRTSALPLTTIERSLEEQSRANDLKSMEIGLTMRKLRLKETELALSYESNNLGKSKLEMGVTKAAFRAEKFKTELEDTRKADMVTKITDWLIVSIFVMVSSMLYGIYVFSHQRIAEATSICEPSEEKPSAWYIPKQVTSINMEFNVMICRIRVWIQIFFGVLMIVVFSYFIIQRSSGTKQTMPVTFIVLFLGIVCGLPGKFCVDTLGGDGKLWLLLWEMFCLLQFVANVFILALYGLLYGSVRVNQEMKRSRFESMVPYWVRRSVFFGVILFVLPVSNGLLPFGSFGEWRDHFAVALPEFLGLVGSDV